ncbi:hypothetical protein CU669_09020 [Paramagnetospirillum kuznetsovii]|uniref:Threonine transporter RhtB n=1 Tax=Paramagnetospirillum kuznetsovii TaxID=2053833 RepID=A0A364NZB4_9PROT|nr:LysE family transporter [Paramagnetospirillum kuznetsovii]RAU22257.1 hypothetical protein CU669_09020 [Paramagnetospirillum kuznetsovii]
MSDPIAFAVAVLTLLATPGPTNTLLAASGATHGLRPSLKLIPAEICGYLITICLLLGIAAPLIAAHAMIGVALKLAACLWLICCATRLWRAAALELEQTRTNLSARRVFVTTLINPKALIFALAIIPPGSPVEIAPWLAAFSGMVIMVATGWVAAGASLARSAGHLATPRRICRATALALVVFAMLVGGSAVTSVY